MLKDQKNLLAVFNSHGQYRTRNCARPRRSEGSPASYFVIGAAGTGEGAGVRTRFFTCDVATSTAP